MGSDPVKKNIIRAHWNPHSSSTDTSVENNDSSNQNILSMSKLNTPISSDPVKNITSTCTWEVTQ